MNTTLALAVFPLIAGVASAQPIRSPIAGTDTDFSKAKTVEVRLSNFDFQPSEIVLRAGQPYILKIVNMSSGGHDFTAPAFFAASTIAAQDVSRVANGEIDIKGGGTESVRLVPRGGSYKLVCTHFGHSFMGMKGRIIVR